MAKKKYYAVKNGKIKGVYLTWNDCQMMVLGYPNAIYKSFEDPYEAIDFIIGNNNKLSQTRKKEDSTSDRNNEKAKDNEKNKNSFDVYLEENKKLEIVEAYVDGSFDVNTKSYGSGGILIFNGKIIEKFSQKGENKERASMRNVAGEIEASMYAMKYCEENGYENLKIYFDYNGIEKWCTGEWKANKEGTKEYKKFYDRISKKINIMFEKVKAHSGVLYNDMADELAKKSIFDI